MAKNNQKRLSVSRLMTPVALAITLAACSSTPKAPVNVDITLDPNQPVNTYLMRADSSQGKLQNDWLIMALKAAIESGDIVQSELLVKRLSRQALTDMQQAEWQLSRAELLISQDQNAQALALLNFRSDWQLVDDQWAEYHQTKAELFTTQANYFDAARELSFLGKYLDETEQQKNAEDIWSNLSLYSSNEIASYTAKPNEADFSGWLKLATYTRAISSNLNLLKASLEKWFAENPDHPATLYTPLEIQQILELEIEKPVNTALLLPLSGKFAQQAQLIRDGFIMAMMNDDERAENATLTVVDTNLKSAQDIKQTLADKDIDFIVGPLLKSNIEQLQNTLAATENKISALALNIPSEIVPDSKICYLALSPEQEVAQAAKHLAAQGYQYPLILAPQGRLGSRVVEAFEAEWALHSENKVAVNLFGDKRQLQRDINKVFGLQSSQQNIAQMEALLDIQLETQPRSRRDVDAVYIVAKSSELTLIKPFIEVAVNPDTVPPKLFSNSRSNSGRQQYEDLTGVMYSDIPLLIQPEQSIQAQMELLWPKDSYSEKRLQALGMDAYQLMEHLPEMKVVEGYSFKGNTGVLSIDENCVVQREISWAEHGASK